MFDKTFCPSPWFHMRVNNDGTYGHCRWMAGDSGATTDHMAQVAPIEWFQQGLAPLRQQLLQGQSPKLCEPCYRMDAHGKVSGRQRQLLKIGVRSEQFVKTMHSSEWLAEFKPDGKTDLAPQDWQIDLGNYCNSACVFCSPRYSSRLATEFKRIGLIDQLPPANWSDDDQLLQVLTDALERSPEVRYIHFIGGETLITPAFRKILISLIDAGLHRSAAVGFTTNLTVWDDHVVELLGQFDTIHLGVSVECLHRANDYARWPSRIADVQTVLERWVALARSRAWYMQMRITPTLLTVGHLTSVYQYALANGLAVESCNFLERPEFLRPTVLPERYRAPAIENLSRWIEQNHTLLDHAQVINTRHPDLVHAQAVQDAQSYVNYLRDQPDESHRLPDLVGYLKKIDASRGIRVIDYLPEYEELFRSAGY